MERDVVEAHKRSVVVTHLQHASLYLMVVPAPPKPIWEVQERVMNNLLFEKSVNPEDVKELDHWLKECAEVATKVLNNSEGTDLRTDSKEFEACFHYYFTLLLTSLIKIVDSNDKSTVDHYVFVVQMALRTIHDFLEGTLKTVVATGFRALSPK